MQKFIQEIIMVWYFIREVTMLTFSECNSIYTARMNYNALSMDLFCGFSNLDMIDLFPLSLQISLTRYFK